ncbi:hypothetical protein IEQ34_007754 [Dendrobium chrysotoxum]|uniref:TRAM domain-containing protein n=1 Tax=Dendrobium chrysotoxum TaxID=161865 RepID=A0AAV7H5L8_DENCH|nr:hypothetical protein IEQ34_007754 [Dendrobium chrysotoxum]
MSHAAKILAVVFIYLGFEEAEREWGSEMEERSREGGEGGAAARVAAAAQDLRKWIELKPSQPAWCTLRAKQRPWLGNRQRLCISRLRQRRNQREKLPKRPPVIAGDIIEIHIFKLTDSERNRVTVGVTDFKTIVISGGSANSSGERVKVVQCKGKRGFEIGKVRFEEDGG